MILEEQLGMLVLWYHQQSQYQHVVQKFLELILVLMEITYHQGKVMYIEDMEAINLKCNLNNEI
jgi:hypothetical protein